MTISILFCLLFSFSSAHRSYSTVLNIEDFLSTEAEACDECVAAFDLGKEHGLAEIALKEICPTTIDDLKYPFNPWRAISMKRERARTLGHGETLTQFGNKFEAWLEKIGGDEYTSVSGIDTMVKKENAKINIVGEDGLGKQELLWYYAGLIGVFLKQAGVQDQYDHTELEVGIRRQWGVKPGYQGYQAGSFKDFMQPQTWHIDSAFESDKESDMKHVSCAPLYFIASNAMETEFVSGNLEHAFSNSSVHGKMWIKLKEFIQKDESKGGLNCPFNLSTVEEGCDVGRFVETVLSKGQLCKIQDPPPASAKDYGPDQLKQSCFLAHFLQNGAVCPSSLMSIIPRYCSETFTEFENKYTTTALTATQVKARFRLGKEPSRHIHTHPSAIHGSRKLTFMGPYQLHVPVNNFHGETKNRWFLRFTLPVSNKKLECRGLRAALEPDDLDDNAQIDETQSDAVEKFQQTGNVEQLQNSLPPSACSERDAKECCSVVGCGLSSEQECSAEIDMDGGFNNCDTSVSIDENDDAQITESLPPHSSPLLRSTSAPAFIQSSTTTTKAECSVTNEELVNEFANTQHDL